MPLTSEAAHFAVERDALAKQQADDRCRSDETVALPPDSSARLDPSLVGCTYREAAADVRAGRSLMRRFIGILRQP